MRMVYKSLFFLAMSLFSVGALASDRAVSYFSYAKQAVFLKISPGHYRLTVPLNAMKKIEVLYPQESKTITMKPSAFYRYVMAGNTSFSKEPPNVVVQLMPSGGVYGFTITRLDKSKKTFVFSLVTSVKRGIPTPPSHYKGAVFLAIDGNEPAGDCTGSSTIAQALQQAEESMIGETECTIDYVHSAACSICVDEHPSSDASADYEPDCVDACDPG